MTQRITLWKTQVKHQIQNQYQQSQKSESNGVTLKQTMKNIHKEEIQ
jgi:hypothetical protein